MAHGLREREAKERLEKLAEILNSLEVDGSLQAQILQELVTERKTIGELAQILYGVKRDDEGFSSSYMRVRRAARRLESKGYVSAPLLGRDKPYRLTRVGAQAIAGILQGHPLLDRSSTRTLILALTAVLGLLVLVSERFPVSARIQLSSLFFVFLGMSILVGASWMSEVW